MAAGSVDSIAELYGEHHGWLKGLFRKKLGCSDTAADLAQDAFLRLILRPPAKGLASLQEARAYLRTMANGMCVDLWRRREVEQAWWQTLAVQPEALMISPEEHAIVVETLLSVAKMLDRLSQKAAAAFVMAQVDGMPYREIGAQLGVSERMVKRYIAQAMLECVLIEAGMAL